MQLKRLFALVTLAISGAFAAEDTKSFLTLSDCVSRGFFPSRLSCETCSVISSAVEKEKAEGIEKDCKQCCRDDTLLRHAPFERARLVVMKSGASGGVQEFLEKSAASYEDVLEVEDAPPHLGHEPKIVLEKGSSNSNKKSKDKAAKKEKEKEKDKLVSVEFKVSSWKTEHIQELLKTYVKGAEGSSK